MELRDYIDKARPQIKALCLKYIAEYKRPLRSHPGRQKGRDGLAIHTIEVIEKALEFNPGYDARDIIETVLAHDLKHWDEFPLLPHQTTAILATRGVPWQVWRKQCPQYRFVALILVADMWSAYLNVQGA